MATTGSIAKLIAEKGFGFITTENGSVFFYASACDANGLPFDALEEGDVVELEIADSPRGPRASWVRCTR